MGTLKTHASAQTVRGTASGARGTLGNALSDLHGQRQMKSAAISGGEDVVQQALDIRCIRIQSPGQKFVGWAF